MQASEAERPAQSVHSPHNNGVTLFGVLEEPFHSGPFNGRLASGGHIGEDIAFLYTGPNQRIQLELRVLAGSTDQGVTQLPHEAILTRKASDALAARRFTARRLYETSSTWLSARSRGRRGPPETRGQCLEKL